MKHIISQTLFLITLFSIFISCSNKDAQPNISTVLKTLSLVSTRYGVKGDDRSKTVYEYLGSDISKATSIDSSTTSDGKTLLINNSSVVATYTDKIITKITTENIDKKANTTTKVEYTIKKVTGGFDIVSKGSNYQIYSAIEVNANDQLTKTKSIKTVYDLLKGPNEILDNSYRRFEYDSKGNIVKTYYSNNGQKEYLEIELTYDSNPSPFLALKWIMGGRFSNSLLPWTDSKNNVMTLRTYTSKGVLSANYNMTYVYDKNTSYPLSTVWTEKMPTSANISTINKFIFTY